MLMSEKIARLIEEMLDENNGILELRRNELAARVGCVPSQINYVITSRFGKDRGYIVESRRGGGGYVRITKLRMDCSSFLLHLLGSIGDSLTEAEAKSVILTLQANGLITAREGIIMSSCVSRSAMSKLQSESDKAIMRAEILKAVLFGLISQGND